MTSLTLCQRRLQSRSQGPLSSFLEKVPWVRLVTCPCIQIRSAPGWVFDLILSKVETALSRGGRNCVCLFKMALTFLSRFQVALISAGYTDIILKVKQVICLEAVLPTGYGKSLVFSTTMCPQQLYTADTNWYPLAQTIYNSFLEFVSNRPFATIHDVENFPALVGKRTRHPLTTV